MDIKISPSLFVLQADEITRLTIKAENLEKRLLESEEALRLHEENERRLGVKMAELSRAYNEVVNERNRLKEALGDAGKPEPEPETCVWRVEDGKRAVTSCYSAVYTWSQIATGPEICPDCGKRVEVRG